MSNSNDKNSTDGDDNMDDGIKLLLENITNNLSNGFYNTKRKKYD